MRAMLGYVGRMLASGQCVCLECWNEVGAPLSRLGATTPVYYRAESRVVCAVCGDRFAGPYTGEDVGCCEGSGKAE